MAYQTGTATSPIDLLQQLVTFLTGHGWTADDSASDGAGWRAHLHLGSQYIHLRAFISEGAGVVFNQMFGSTKSGIALYGSTAFNGSVAWNVQPGSPPYQQGSSTNVVGAAMQLNDGGAAISNYYFFCDGSDDNVVVVVEKTPGNYAHMGWGSSLAKAGTWTGGQYFFGSSQGYYSGETIGGNSSGYSVTAASPGSHGEYAGAQATYVRVDIDTFTGQWIGISDNVNAGSGYTGKNGASSVVMTGLSNNPRSEVAYYASSAGAASGFQTRQTSTLDGRANLLPVLLWGARDSSGYSLIGTLPNLFSTNAVGSGFAPASIYSIGSTNYMVFPNFAVVKQ